MTYLPRSSTAKRAVGQFAASLIQDGMIVGLGTGSTTRFFIEALIQRCREGLKIPLTVATSKESQRLAEAGGLRVLDINAVSQIDIDVDGADEIDLQKRLIKGGGGALLREKIIAQASTEMLVIVDQHKLVNKLGAFGIPVEVIPFGCMHTLKHIEKLNCKGKLRTIARSPKDSNAQDQALPFITDNGNYIIDVTLAHLCEDPEALDQAFKMLSGVVETGFFINLAKRVLVGFDDGHVELRE
jgi:ribose 5-phosphate isomerase A